MEPRRSRHAAFILAVTFRYPRRADYEDLGDSHNWWRNAVADWWMYRALPLTLLIGLAWALAGCVEHLDLHLFEKAVENPVQKTPDGTPCVKWPSLAVDARTWLDAQATAPASLGSYFAEIAALQGVIKDCPKESQ